MKILVLDNYDSFTYNLVQYIQEIIQAEVDVYRNDEITLDAVADYEVIILSPGPGLPAQAGIMPELIQRYAAEKSILGVCLGHQAIGEAFGADLENLSKVFHGIETPIRIIDETDPVLKDVSEVFQAGRYHSWVIEKNSLPDSLKITAIDVKGEIMAMRHKSYKLFGLQFHPESIMTPEGKKMLENFLTFSGVTVATTENILP
jgi:anthranilate synthase component 2